MKNNNQQKLYPILKNRMIKEVNLAYENYLGFISARLYLQSDGFFHTLSTNPFTEKTPHSVYYLKNSESYVFKLFDNSIIQASYQFEGNEIIKHRYVYISPYYGETVLSLMAEEITLSEQLLETDNLPEYDDTFAKNIKKNRIIRQFIETHLKASGINIDTIIETVNDLQINPVIIRIDYAKKTIPNHPKIHLTINNVEQSRFLVKDILSLQDFLEFILNIIYGLFSSENQYINIK